MTGLSQKRTGRTRNPRLIPGVLSVAAHGAIVLAIMFVHADAPAIPDSTPVPVTLIDGFQLTPQPAPAAPTPPTETPKAASAPTPAKAPPVEKPAPVRKARPVTVRPDVVTLAAGEAGSPAPALELSDAQLAGASTADSGGAGGGAGGSCNMVRWLQRQLRKNPNLQGMVAGASTARRGLVVWNGDWVRSGVQEGKGLAGVRQAVMVEIAFAPDACKAERAHGVVLVSLADVPGAPKIAFGPAEWRWSDLLFPR